MSEACGISIASNCFAPPPSKTVGASDRRTAAPPVVSNLDLFQGGDGAGAAKMLTQGRPVDEVVALGRLRAEDRLLLHHDRRLDFHERLLLSAVVADALCG